MVLIDADMEAERPGELADSLGGSVPEELSFVSSVPSRLSVKAEKSISRPICTR